MFTGLGGKIYKCNSINGTKMRCRRLLVLPQRI